MALNPQNLRVPTSEEARKNGAKGGKASAEARRRKKQMRELAEIALATPMRKGRRDNIKTIEDLKKTGPDGRNIAPNITVEEFAVFSIAKKAMAGDVQAMTFLRDLVGEKPVDQIEVSAPVEEAAAEIEAIIAAKKKKEPESDDG